ncbi:MAG: hypothetical protein QOJ40_1055 [Verrucomicrobiota bacterium]
MVSFGYVVVFGFKVRTIDLRIVSAVFRWNGVLSLPEAKQTFMLSLLFFSAVVSFHIATAELEGASASEF